MKASDREAFRPQKILQHPAAREGEVEMQFIHAPHHGKIGR
jgi:hypothetical protein